MPQKFTKLQVLNRAHEVHGDKYYKTLLFS